MTSRKRSSDLQGIKDGAGPLSKKARVSSGDAPTVKVDSNGDQYWEISKMRRVTVSSFRGKTLVNVREYYEKDGQELPGKKGISMSVDQFASLVKLLPDIEHALKQQGVSLPRPVYSENGGQLDTEVEDESGQERLGRNASALKQNIDATSDEDEGKE